MTYAALGYYSLGALGQQSATAAGPINGVATLRADVQRSAAAAVEAYGSDLNYDQSAFRELLRRFKEEPERATNSQLEPGQVRNFVIGVIAETAAAVARAEQLAALPVRGPVQLEENRRAQAELIGAGRILLDACNTTLASVVPVRGGASGLGEPLTAGVLIAITVVAVIVGVAAVAAIALCYDSMQRMVQARGTAQRICHEAQGGCTPEQYAQIVDRLRLGPFDDVARGAAAAAEGLSEAASTALVVAGVGAALLGGAWFLFGTEAGRRTLAGIRRERSGK